MVGSVRALVVNLRSGCDTERPPQRVPRSDRPDRAQETTAPIATGNTVGERSVVTSW